MLLTRAIRVCVAAIVVSVVIAVPADAETGSSGRIARAICDGLSAPETGVQGQVPLIDRESGRSARGYSCNLALVGRYQGSGASWVSPSYGHCAYMSSAFPSSNAGPRPGVNVIDVSDPTKPALSARLTSPAMAGGTWESLKVNERRGLLAAVAGGVTIGVGSFDIYDISRDCAHPRLLNGVGGSNHTLPVNTLGHEGGFSPDGRTYWSTGIAGGITTAIDVSDPTRPRTLTVGSTGLTNHGFSFSSDGTRLYATSQLPGGIVIADVSTVQKRSPLPHITPIASKSWNDGLSTQATLPFSRNGRPMLAAWDEFGSDGIRFFDITAERTPRQIAQMRLEINLPGNIERRRQDTTGTGLFGYETHYCSIDSPTDPTRMACGFMQSGIRVFDISDLRRPKEIAYYNPPAQTGKNAQLPNSEHAAGLLGSASPVLSDALNGNVGEPAPVAGPAQLSADYCSSPPRFFGDQLWVTCQDNGFLVLAFTS